MNIYSILQLCGGLAFFLFGMHVMSGSLEKLAGGNLQKILKEVTSNPIKSLFFGAIVTIAIQSSSALTVMLVGLVNSGIMELAQTVGVIMGSNIGTTLTAWILSLSGIESDNLFISMLKPENFSPVIALIGVIMIMGSKKEKRKDVGIIMAGFAVLMYGMQLMSGAVSPLADMPEFTGLLTTFNNPFLGVLVGAVFTGVIQSSAASVGVLQALAMTGACDSISVVVRQTILQIFPPENMRGRVAAVNGMFVSSSNELGAFESGLAAKYMGTLAATLFGGCMTLAVVILSWTKTKDLFHVDINKGTDP